MSISSDLKEMERTRAREVAIRAALKSMAGGDDAGIEELVPITSEATESSTPTVSEEIPLVLPPYDETTSPARVVGAPEKPWLRAGKQWRPQNSRERQGEQDEMMDRKALDNLQAYRVLQARSHDEFELEKAATAKRNAYEARTGRRKMPDQRMPRGYVGAAEPTPPAENPWDNRGGSDRFGSE
jgi:hypothetical protein